MNVMAMLVMTATAMILLITSVELLAGHALTSSLTVRAWIMTDLDKSRASGGYSSEPRSATH